MYFKALNMMEMLHAILGSVEEGIHAVDREGITVFYNQVAGRLDGLVPEEVVGRHVLEVFPSLRKDTSTLLQVLGTGNRIEHVRQTYTTVRGKKVHTVNSTLPIFADEQLVGAVEVAKDLTQVKELSEKLIDLQAQLSSPRKKTAGSLLEARYTFEDIVTRDNRLIQLKELAARAAATDSSVLVCGETGTGKELFVQAIHNLSPRRRKPFIAQNCAALPASLLEGLLFGTIKGSFTGAENRPGLFELAHGGTLFLDEINSMPMELQAKLLRVLQEKHVRRVGDTKLTPVDVRVLAATSSDPLAAIEQKLLRSDLYYRLNVVYLSLPRLAERRADIPLLTKHFLDIYNEQMGKQVADVEPQVMDCFLQYDWPGNVRELQHAIEGAMNLVRGKRIGLNLLPWQIQRAFGIQTAEHAVRNSLQGLRNSTTGTDAETNSPGSEINSHVADNPAAESISPIADNPAAESISVSSETNGPSNNVGSEPGAHSWDPVAIFRASGLSLREFLDGMEKEITKAVISETKGNVIQAAKKLGIPRQTLQYRLARNKGDEK